MTSTTLPPCLINAPGNVITFHLRSPNPNRRLSVTKCYRLEKGDEMGLELTKQLLRLLKQI